MTKEKKPEYKSFQKILTFLSFDYNFERKRCYPFNKDPKDIVFSWGQIVIPKKGIYETVQNKISDIKEQPLSEITMLYQVPFIVDSHGKDTRDFGLGTVNQNISLTFRYDEEYKYGEVTKSIYEVCYFITQHAIETNDFFIIKDYVQEFFSYYIIPNQWGLGSLECFAGCKERYFGTEKTRNDRYPKLYKCSCCECVVDPVDGKCTECGSTLKENEVILSQSESSSCNKQTDKQMKIPSVDCDFPCEPMQVPEALSGACFHGESWYRCPHCKGSFEAHDSESFQRSLYNKNIMFCPHCGYGFVMK